LPPGIAWGNRRIEADQIDIDSKFAGRIAEILADEGDMVKAGQVVARMDTQERRYHRPLSGALFTDRHGSIFENARLEPFLDQMEDGGRDKHPPARANAHRLVRERRTGRCSHIQEIAAASTCIKLALVRFAVAFDTVLRLSSIVRELPNDPVIAVGSVPIGKTASQAHRLSDLELERHVCSHC
jgi:hypothetical protein